MTLVKLTRNLEDSFSAQQVIDFLGSCKNLDS